MTDRPGDRAEPLRAIQTSDSCPPSGARFHEGSRSRRRLRSSQAASCGLSQAIASSRAMLAGHHRCQVPPVPEVSPVGGDPSPQAGGPPQVQHPSASVPEPVHPWSQRQQSCRLPRAHFPLPYEQPEGEETGFAMQTFVVDPIYFGYWVTEVVDVEFARADRLAADLDHAGALVEADDVRAPVR